MGGGDRDREMETVGGGRRWRQSRQGSVTFFLCREIVLKKQKKQQINKEAKERQDATGNVSASVRRACARPLAPFDWLLPASALTWSLMKDGQIGS